MTTGDKIILINSTSFYIFRLPFSQITVSLVNAICSSLDPASLHSVLLSFILHFVIYFLYAIFHLLQKGEYS